VDNIHAGGFCFGKKKLLPIPKQENKAKKSPNKNLKTSPDEMFQNHCLHFSFLCFVIAHNKATQETNITLIEEKEKDLLMDYLPDENIMNILFECLLDCHPTFAPAKDTKKKAKTKDKTSKAHVASLKEK